MKLYKKINGRFYVAGETTDVSKRLTRGESIESEKKLFRDWFTTQVKDDISLQIEDRIDNGEYPEDVSDKVVDDVLNVFAQYIGITLNDRSQEYVQDRIEKFVDRAIDDYLEDEDAD